MYDGNEDVLVNVVEVLVPETPLNSINHGPFSVVVTLSFLRLPIVEIDHETPVIT